MRIKPAFEKDVLNNIYDSALQFGENWRKPIIELVEEQYPNMSLIEQKELADYIEDTRNNIEKYIYDSYSNTNKEDDKVLHNKVSLYIEKEYPWMNPHKIGHAISQGIYYAWRG